MSTEHPRRKLLFHIGHHKTGSTTIQNAFATGRVVRNYPPLPTALKTVAAAIVWIACPQPRLEG